MNLLKFITGRKKTFNEVIASLEGVQFNPAASWNDYTSLGAGIGTFPVLKIATLSQIAYLVKQFRKHLPDYTLRPIGGGTNLIGADRIIPKTVFLKLLPGADFSRIEHIGKGLFRSGAANSLKNVLDFTCGCGFGGASGLYGIPGTIGGATIMNAGACGQSVGDFIDFVEMINLETGKMTRLQHKGIVWEYRHTSLPANVMILRVAFRLQPIVPQMENELHKREMLRRMRCPAGRSSGSVFKNPSPLLSAGKILEKCGAKGLINGRFQVSPDHANWILNRTDLKGEDVSASAYVETLNKMAQKVYDATGILLHPEVKFLDSQNISEWGKDRKMIKVLVLKGGVSSEREISLMSAANVASTLRDAGFEVREFDITKLEITPDMHWADVVYPVLHGGFGEDGRLQKLLEDAKIRSVGSPSEAMKIVMDKTATKKVMDSKGIRNAKYAVITDPSASEGLSFPLIVKPNSEGSTFGLSLVEDESQWRKALEFALKYDNNVLVEEFIDGVEATVSILLGKVLPIVEIRYPSRLYDYDAKYTHAQGETEYICPPSGISQAAQDEAKKLSLELAKAVGAETLLRVDVMIRRSDDKVFVLEGNSMPGCTASSLLPKAAMASGLSLTELYSGLVMSALKKVF